MVAVMSNVPKVFTMDQSINTDSVCRSGYGTKGGWGERGECYCRVV